MVSLINTQNRQNSKLTPVAVAPIQRLARAMMVSYGQFSLILSCCNSLNKQQQILGWLQEFSEVKFQEIIIPTEAETLYTNISNSIGTAQPEALMVRGLESVVEINKLVVSTNLMRDELRKQFQFPLVLWVNDDILRKLVWLAPDLKDWAASTIRFDTNNDIIEQPLSA